MADAEASIRAALERDYRIWGSCWVRIKPDGTRERVDPREVYIEDTKPSSALAQSTPNEKEQG